MLHWINVSDLLSESLSRRSGGEGVRGKKGGAGGGGSEVRAHERSGGVLLKEGEGGEEDGAVRRKEREIVRQSDSARRSSRWDCSSSLRYKINLSRRRGRVALFLSYMGNWCERFGCNRCRDTRHFLNPCYRAVTGRIDK